MTREAYMGYAPLLNRYAKGMLTDLDLKMMQDQAKLNAAYIVDGNDYEDEVMMDMSNAPAGSILVLPIKGAITKESYCGDKGTAEIMDILKQADASPNISKVILDIDSGGGSVDGTFELADYISNSFTKPIIAFVNGCACSAAYAIACACDEIVMSHATAMIGSIGVAVTIRNYDKSDELEGIKEHYITADGSEDKNKDYLDARDGKYDTIKIQSLNPTREIFVNLVTKNRSGVDASVFSGKCYLGQEAIALKLADRIAMLDEVIEEVDPAAIEAGKYKIEAKPKFKMFNKFPKMAALKGLSADLLTEDRIAEVNREILENGIEGIEIVREGTIEAAVEAAIVEAGSTLNAQVETLNASIAERDTQIETLNAEVVRLGQIVPEAHTNVVKVGADVTEVVATELSDADKRLQAQAAAELANMNL